MSNKCWTCLWRRNFRTYKKFLSFSIICKSISEQLANQIYEIQIIFFWHTFKNHFEYFKSYKVRLQDLFNVLFHSFSPHVRILFAHTKIFSFYISKHLPCVRMYVKQYQLEKTSIYGFEWSWHLITKNLNQTIQTEMTSVHLHFNEQF